jgi:hypothetical protein
MPRNQAKRDYPPAGELVDVFFRTVSDEFAFLSDEYGARSKRTLSAVRTKGLEEIEPVSLPDDAFFLAELRFEGPDWKVRVTFGDREFVINTVFTSASAEVSKTEYALWEWLEALGVEAHGARDSMWSMRPERIRSVVHGMAAALRRYHHEILHPARDVAHRVGYLGEKRLTEWTEAQLASDLRRASAKASEAFRAGKFEAVVKLLEPFVGRLSAAQATKLDFARRHVGKGGSGGRPG